MSEPLKGIRDVEKVMYAKRGTITDRNNVVLAHDVVSYTLYAILDETRLTPKKEPAYVFDKELTAQTIAEVLNVPFEEVMKQLQKDSKQVEFGAAGKYISLDQKNQLEAAQLPGLGYDPILSRNYPLAPFAPNLVGFARFEEAEKEIKGHLGIEALYNEELQGKNGFKKIQTDRDGYEILRSENETIDPVNGYDIKLTLDRSIQEQMESSMSKISDGESAANEVWGSVMEVKTGKILAWGEYPRFDPNDPNTNWNSRGAQYEFEPGSTMKSFTVAAAIDQGVWDDNYTLFANEFHFGVKNGKGYRLPTPQGAVFTINNVNKWQMGTISYQTGFAMSSNVMIADLLTREGGLDQEIFHNYLGKLGFFAPVSMDRIKDSSGVDLWNYPLEKVSNGFGQGSTVTMLQMMQAYTTVLGDGHIVKPYIVDEMKDPNTNEVVYKAKPTIGKKVFKESTAEKIKHNMRDVVTNGTMGGYYMPDIEIIGKTGTAQMVVDGRYSPEEYIFSAMVGLPYDDPQVMVYVVYQAKYSHNRTPAIEQIKEIIRKVVATYDFDQDVSSNFIEETRVDVLDHYINQSTLFVLEDLREKKYNSLVIGNGDNVIKQYPAPGSKLLSNEIVMLFTGGDEIKMPDMHGWSYKQVSSFWSMTHLQVEISGSGFVVEQSIKPGTVLTQDSVVGLHLELGA